MSTQGLVTVRSEGRVVMKIVAGCNGQLANLVAARFKVAWPVNAEEAFKIARATGFGCDNCLIVATDSGIVLGGKEEPLPPIYRETFQKPDFNPRWRQGTVDFFELVDLEAGVS